METEKLARELRMIRDKALWESNKSRYACWNEIAEYVQRLIKIKIIEAKIESHSFYLSNDAYDSDGMFAKYCINQLQAERDLLEEG